MARTIAFLPLLLFRPRLRASQHCGILIEPNSVRKQTRRLDVRGGLVRKLCIVAFVLGAFARGSAQAEILPSFSLEYCTWHASHIVEVSQGLKRDGVLTVTNSWKGDLKNGEVLSFPDLQQFAWEERRKILVFPGSKVPPKRVTHVSGLRMVLFLKKNDQAGRDPNKAHSWQGTSWGSSINTSLAWMDAGEAFAYVQIMNPGGQVIWPLEMTEMLFKEKVTQIARTKENLNQVLALKDAGRRAKGLRELVQTGLPLCEADAVEALGQCGEQGLPVIQELVDKSPRMTVTANLIRAMGKIGGANAGKQLLSLLKEEFVFWQKRGPQLKNDWWQDWTLGQQEVYSLRDRNTKFNAILGGLADADYEECRPLIRDVYAFLKNHPHLDTSGGVATLRCRMILKDSLP